MGSVVILLPGAGNHPPDPGLFRTGAADNSRVEIIRYPGWRTYVEDRYTADELVRDLAEEIATRAGADPIWIVGMSIGGHLGYATAIHLEASGKRVDGFCALDAFMVSSASLRPGWGKRAVSRGAELLRKRRGRDLLYYVRSLIWRAVFRLAGARLVSFCRLLASCRPLSFLLRADHVFEEELSMRLLLRLVNPWVATLDVAPTALNAPSILLRTGGTALHDGVWQRRCPNIRILDIRGDHSTMFEPENAGSLHQLFLTATSDWRQR
jgi:thioesterase domain-containing protein